MDDIIPTTAFGNIRLHISRHQYIRGNHKGEAPADPHRRKRSQERVRIVGNTAYARWYSTDVLAFHEDGSLTLDAGGWMGSSTTRAFVNSTLRRFAPSSPVYGCVSTVRKFGISTTCVYTARGWTPHYDGITLNPDGTLKGDPIPFRAKRVDTDRTREFAGTLKANGFKDMFPIIHANADMDGWSLFTTDIAHALTEGSPEVWPKYIAHFKFTQDWRRDETGAYKRVYVARTPKETWTLMMREAKARMVMVVPTSTCYVE